jgi:hypothetical protein
VESRVGIFSEVDATCLNFNRAISRRSLLPAAPAAASGQPDNVRSYHASYRIACQTLLQTLEADRSHVSSLSIARRVFFPFQRGQEFLHAR